ncbi:MAG: hypothetical protein J1F03_03645 [Oscillospiraceae bacterium]|nr:hypothetical protein [Oscillospiraceae bacterium]
MYIISGIAWAGIDEAVYMNPFLLMVVYIFYIWLIIPFNLRYSFAAIRNPDQTEYKLIFLVKLAAFSVLYEGVLSAEIGIIGLITGDIFVFDRILNYMIHLLLNLNIFNTLYILMCDKFKIITARIIAFTLPVVGVLLNNFGREAVYKLNFIYFGIHVGMRDDDVSVLNAAIVYIVVFGGSLILTLKMRKTGICLV